jgi:hypothetical protein
LRDPAPVEFISAKTAKSRPRILLCKSLGTRIDAVCTDPARSAIEMRQANSSPHAPFRVDPSPSVFIRVKKARLQPASLLRRIP